MDLALYRSINAASVEPSYGRLRGVLVGHGDEGVAFPGIVDVRDFTISEIRNNIAMNFGKPIKTAFW